MIDVHCHILPQVDDGSFSMEESLKMAALAVESGVTDVIATPHSNLPRSGEWAPRWVHRERMEALQRELDRAGLPLRLHQGMEIFGLPNTPDMLEEGLLTTLNGSRYPLVEFPFHHYGEEATALLDRLLRQGYRPLVAHPERYVFLQREPELTNLWTDMGCLLQINRGSLLGRFGEGPEAMAYALLERGFVTAVASDAHRATVRTPWMEDVRGLLAEEWGEGVARRLLEENPRRILLDRGITMEEPDWF